MYRSPTLANSSLSAVRSWPRRATRFMLAQRRRFRTFTAGKLGPRTAALAFIGCAVGALISLCAAGLGLIGLLTGDWLALPLVTLPATCVAALCTETAQIAHQITPEEG